MRFLHAESPITVFMYVITCQEEYCMHDNLQWVDYCALRSLLSGTALPLIAYNSLHTCFKPSTMQICNVAQAVGPVALVSLLLNNGLTKIIPAAEINTNPNHPVDPAVQIQYNHAAIQVRW